MTEVIIQLPQDIATWLAPNPAASSSTLKKYLEEGKSVPSSQVYMSGY